MSSQAYQGDVIHEGQGLTGPKGDTVGWSHYPLAVCFVQVYICVKAFGPFHHARVRVTRIHTLSGPPRTAFTSIRCYWLFGRLRLSILTPHRFRPGPRLLNELVEGQLTTVICLKEIDNI